MSTSRVQQLADDLIAECLRLQEDNDKLRLHVTNGYGGTDQGSCTDAVDKVCTPTQHQVEPPRIELVTDDTHKPEGPTEEVDESRSNSFENTSNTSSLVDVQQERKIRKVTKTYMASLAAHKRQRTQNLGPPSFWDRLRSYFQQEKTAEKIVESTGFEVFFALLILFNVGVMALEAQKRGMDIGYDLEYAGYPRLGEDAWPRSSHVFHILEYVLLVMFLLELLIKIVAMKHKFIKSGWNLFDALTILCSIPSVFGGMSFRLDPSILRLLRLARMSRLARVMKKFEFCDSLRVIYRSITASTPILVWTSIILFICEALVGLVLHSLLVPYMENPQMTDIQRATAFKYFGTFSRSMISMTELTLGNFVPVLRFLCDNVDEWYGHGILVYKMIVGFAVIRVIGGVFINETFKTAAQDDELMVVQKKRAQLKHKAKMLHFMKKADQTGDGIIDRREFHEVCQDANMRVWLAAQDVDISNIDLLFDLIDTGDPEVGKKDGITHAELSDGIARLKGPARSLDVVTLLFVTWNLTKMLKDFKKECKLAPPTFEL